MSAYLKFFELEQSPFEGKAQSQVVLGTRALRDAFATIRSGLDEGASRLCVSGPEGLGKTSLARALPKLLGEEARVANVLDASIGWDEGRTGIARQWGLEDGRLSRSALITARADRRLVLVGELARHARRRRLGVAGADLGVVGQRGARGDAAVDGRLVGDHDRARCRHGDGPLRLAS